MAASPILFATKRRVVKTAVLNTLVLGANSIGDEGAKAIADALNYKYKSVLNTLDLRNNGIGDSGAIAIADALK